jgi:hypothetical protein
VPALSPDFVQKESQTMKKIIATLFAALAMFGATSAHAYTDCVTTVAYVLLDDIAGTPTLQVLSSSGVGFSIAASNTNAPRLAALSQAAMTIGGYVNMRFAASGVNCATAAYRTDLQLLAIGN